MSHPRKVWNAPKRKSALARKNAPKDRPTIGLSMIVKNGGEDLRKCLQSAAPLVSQIIVADTGSTDNSKEIAAEMGATVIDIPWTNDFAAARNAALEHITTDWVLSLDADEELPPESIEIIKKLVAKAEGVGGFHVRVRNYFHKEAVIFHGSPSKKNTDPHPRAAEAKSWGEVWICKLFRRHPKIRYWGRVHEQVEYTMPESGLKMLSSKIRILHFGQLAEAEVHEFKANYYLELARQKVKDDPDVAQGWLELGFMEFIGVSRLEEAIEAFQKSVALDDKNVEAWQWLCSSLHKAGDHEQGLNAYRQMVEKKLYIPYLIYVWSGDYLHDIGNFEEALDCYQKALGMSKVDESVAGYVGRDIVKSRLGYLEVRMGRKDGLEKIKDAVLASPDRFENHDRLVKAQVLLGDVQGAAEAALVGLAKFPSEKHFVRAAALCVKAGRAELAKEVLSAGQPYFTSEQAYKKATSALA